MFLSPKRFVRAGFLQQLDRELLNRFLQQFQPQIQQRGLRLPEEAYSEETYGTRLAALLATPEGLPPELNEALLAIEELASPEAQEHLEAAAVSLGVQFRPGAARADMALAVWLNDPRAIARLHKQQRLRRLTTFEYFGSNRAPALRPVFVTPGPELLQQLQAALDPWFATHHRGQDTTRLELYEFAGPLKPASPEWWFVVRHGDTFTRKAKVEAQQTQILHFRPERDDLVVYSSVHDELRIHARTKGERDWYVKLFGSFLRGAEDYFSRRSIYTLEPLRLEGPGALAVGDLQGIHKIVLKELELAWDNPLEGRIIRKADDLFATVAARQLEVLLPARAHLARAVFEVCFLASDRPRPVEIRPPNVLKLGRHCDAQQVDGWFCRSGFRLPQLP